MRRKHRPKMIFVVSALLIFMVGCAGWGLLTPDEKARVVVDGIQEQLEQRFDDSKAYVDLHPEYQTKWDTQIVPAFNLANKTLKEVEDLASMELITPDEVRRRVTPLINSVIRYLGDIGFLD